MRRFAELATQFLQKLRQSFSVITIQVRLAGEDSFDLASQARTFGKAKCPQ